MSTAKELRVIPYRIQFQYPEGGSQSIIMIAKAGTKFQDVVDRALLENEGATVKTVEIIEDEIWLIDLDITETKIKGTKK